MQTPTQLPAEPVYGPVFSSIGERITVFHTPAGEIEVECILGENRTWHYDNNLLASFLHARHETLSVYGKIFPKATAIFYYYFTARPKCLEGLPDIKRRGVYYVRPRKNLQE